MNVVVISLGGSLIVPNDVNLSFLSDFKRTLRSQYKSFKFVVVCGGGVIARKYISVLRHAKKSQGELTKAGVRATRMNARFMMQLFGKEANDSLPSSMKQVKDNLPKNKVVFCGALRFFLKATSDTTAAKLANFLGVDFINVTNVLGLYSKNPNVFKNARFVPRISFGNFESLALSIPFKAGQNFVLDQQAAVIIRKNRIKTVIVGPNTKNLSNFLNGKRFIGTTIGDFND